MALPAPASTVIEVGTVRLELLSDKATEMPPLGAAPLNVTVQFVLPGVVMLTGVQDTVVRVGEVPPDPVMVPPAAESVTALPEDEAATVFVTPMEVLVTPAAMVTFTVATAPFEITFAFKPEARQV